MVKTICQSGREFEISNNLFQLQKGPNCYYCKFVLNEVIMKLLYQIILSLIQSTIILASFNTNSSI